MAQHTYFEMIWSAMCCVTLLTGHWLVLERQADTNSGENVQWDFQAGSLAVVA